MDQQRNESPASTSSSLSYLSFIHTVSEQTKKWKPRRRHAAPPVLPAHRRAKGYADLLPFEVSQLASVLCHGPPANTPHDGAVWAAYVTHTNDRMAFLGPKLRAATAIPSFLPRSVKYGLCNLHRRLNPKPLEDMFAALRYEVETRVKEVWEPVALAGGLSASQIEQFALLDEMQALWLAPAEFMKKFNRLPSPKYGQQTDGCVACILARMAGSVETAMALGALLLGSMRRSDMLSTRVCFCREWVRYTVEGDVDCVDTALAEMGKMGTRLREARRWARQRWESKPEHHDRNLGLGGMPYVQPERVSSLQKDVAKEPQISFATRPTSDALQQQHNSHQKKPAVGHQLTYQPVTLEPSSFPQTSPGSYLPDQLSSDPLVDHTPSSKLHSPGQSYHVHTSPEHHQFHPGYSVSPSCSPQSGLPLQRHGLQHSKQESWQGKSKLVDPNVASTTSQTDQTSNTTLPTQTRPASLRATSTALTKAPSAVSSLYSEYTQNPFRDENCISSPMHSPMPPDLPLRLFSWRRADVDTPSSPPKDAVQWPVHTPSPKPSTAEHFKDGLSPVPTLAKLEGDRGVGALWKRRTQRTMAGRGDMK